MAEIDMAADFQMRILRQASAMSRKQVLLSFNLKKSA